MHNARPKRYIKAGLACSGAAEVHISNVTCCEDLTVLSAIFYDLPLCTQASQDQKVSIGFQRPGQEHAIVCVGKAGEFRQAFAGMLAKNGDCMRRKGYTSPMSLAKAQLAAAEVYANLNWHPGQPLSLPA